MSDTHSSDPAAVRAAPRRTARLARDVLLRFRAADGATHVRALAYQVMFVTISGFIGLVGLAGVLDVEQLRGVVEELARSLLPGSSGELVQQTIRQGSSSGSTAAIVGLLAAASAGTLAMAQIERSANRLAGSNEDHPGVRRYLRAAAFALTVGVLFAAGTLLAAGGGAIAGGLGWSGALATVWSIARWPVGGVVVCAATFLLFRYVPRERLGDRRALVAGSLVGVVLWLVFSGLLAAYFALRADSENPYGPMLAVIALLLWSMLTSLAFHLGMSTACELGGRRRPSDGDVVHLPDAEQGRLAPTSVPAAP